MFNEPPKMYIRKYSPVMFRLARESRGMTQQQLAKKSGVDQCTISRYENGVFLKADPSDVAAIADATQYLPSFFERIGEEEATAELPFACPRMRDRLESQKRAIDRKMKTLNCEGR